MIFHPAGGGTLRAITQPDHAHFSGELLALWRADGLPEHPRRREILFAARHHDNGWREIDAAPLVDPETGRPRDFRHMPLVARLEIWRRGTARYAGEHPYAALLITEHARVLHADQRGDEAWGELFAELDERREALLAATGFSAAELAGDYRFLALADLVSLAACNRWREPFEHGGVGGRVEAEGKGDGVRVHLDPRPLAGATTFRVPCRRIPDRPYRGDADLGVELASARWGEMNVRVS